MMADPDFAQAQRQRDENHLAALYQQHGEALVRTCAQDDKLERTRRAFESATASARIARLELEVAERALKQHIDAIADRSSAISPIQRLPLELLLRIFQSLLEGSGARCQSTFIVASVCRRWRTLAVDSAAVWSIYLDLDKRPMYATEYVRTVLARSRNRSLLVSISAPQELDAEMVDNLNDTLPDVITRSNDLSIIACRPSSSSGDQDIDLASSIFQFLQLSTPYLRRLTIYGNGVHLGDARLLPAAPLLVWVKSYIYPMSGLPTGPLHTVQELALRAQTEGLDLALLCAAGPHLRRLTITRGSPSWRNRVRKTTPASAPLPYLEYLELDGISILLRFPRDGLPALTHLTVNSSRFTHDNSAALPSMPRLRELTLSGLNPFRLAPYIPLFRHVAQVESLVLLLNPRDAIRLRSFWTPWAQRDNVEALPRLRDITIQGTGSTPLDNVAGFSEFLEARAALSTDEATAAYKSPHVTFKNVALPRWELVQLERFVGSIVITDK